MDRQSIDAKLKFLLDTNIVIPIEPTSAGNLEDNSDSIAQFLGMVVQGKHDVYIHPHIKLDLDRDKDKARQRARRVLLKKYQKLPDPPTLSPLLKLFWGDVDETTHDFVDHSLLSAVLADAVDFLVTEDREIRNKALRLGIVSRVISVREALTVLVGLAQKVADVPPAVRDTYAHSLNEKDAIFSSLRDDYTPDFDGWLRKCKRQHRRTWIVDGNSGRYAGICIAKDESSAPIGANGASSSGRILKLCTLKVAAEYYGYRFGELLLKTIFKYAQLNHYEWLYVTCFDRHRDLIALLSDFGFEDNNAPGEERCLIKKLTYSEAERVGLDPLSFHIKYGPHAIDLHRPDYFFIPIRPVYHDMLFPDAAIQRLLMVGRDPFGNSIRKAYLCNAAIKDVSPGSVLLFYRSGDAQAVSVVGVAEDTLRSDSPNVIARFVGKRTVYSAKEIGAMCRRPVLAILFRQSRIMGQSLMLKEIIKEGILSSAPQSIVGVREEGKHWLAKMIEARS